MNGILNLTVEVAKIRKGIFGTTLRFSASFAVK